MAYDVFDDYETVGQPAALPPRLGVPPQPSLTRTTQTAPVGRRRSSTVLPNLPDPSDPQYKGAMFDYEEEGKPSVRYYSDGLAWYVMKPGEKAPAGGRWTEPGKAPAPAAAPAAAAPVAAPAAPAFVRPASAAEPPRAPRRPAGQGLSTQPERLTGDVFDEYEVVPPKPPEPGVLDFLKRRAGDILRPFSRAGTAGVQEVTEGLKEINPFGRGTERADPSSDVMLQGPAAALGRAAGGAMRIVGSPFKAAGAFLSSPVKDLPRGIGEYRPPLGDTGLYLPSAAQALESIGESVAQFTPLHGPARPPLYEQYPASRRWPGEGLPVQTQKALPTPAIPMPESPLFPFGGRRKPAEPEPTILRGRPDVDLEPVPPTGPRGVDVPLLTGVGTEEILPAERSRLLGPLEEPLPPLLPSAAEVAQERTGGRIVPPERPLPPPPLTPTPPDLPRGRIPFMITRDMEVELRRLGFDQSEIRSMTPAEATSILEPAKITRDMEVELRRLGFTGKQVKAMTPERAAALLAKPEGPPQPGVPTIEEQARGARIAESGTAKERERLPLFAEQIPERKPEDYAAGLMRHRESREAQHAQFVEQAKADREFIAGRVSPEELAALDRRQASSPDSPEYAADFWGNLRRRAQGVPEPTVTPHPDPRMRRMLGQWLPGDPPLEPPGAGAPAPRPPVAPAGAPAAAAARPPVPEPFQGLVEQVPTGAEAQEAAGLFRQLTGEMKGELAQVPPKPPVPEAKPPAEPPHPYGIRPPTPEMVDLQAVHAEMQRKEQAAYRTMTAARGTKDYEAAQAAHATAQRNTLDVEQQIAALPAPLPSGPVPAGITGLPPVPEGMVRLYRGQGASAGAGIPDWVKQGLEEQGVTQAMGRWFTEKPDYAGWYVSDAGPSGHMVYLDVPQEMVEAHRVSRLGKGHPAFRQSADPEHEIFLPTEYVGKGKVIPDEAGPVRAGEPGVIDVQGGVVEPEPPAPKGPAGAPPAGNAAEGERLLRELADKQNTLTHERKDLVPEGAPPGWRVIGHFSKARSARENVGQLYTVIDPAGHAQGSFFGEWLAHNRLAELTGRPLVDEAQKIEQWRQAHPEIWDKTKRQPPAEPPAAGPAAEPPIPPWMQAANDVAGKLIETAKDTQEAQARFLGTKGLTMEQARALSAEAKAQLNTEWQASPEWQGMNALPQPGAPGPASPASRAAQARVEAVQQQIDRGLGSLTKRMSREEAMQSPRMQKLQADLQKAVQERQAAAFGDLQGTLEQAKTLVEPPTGPGIPKSGQQIAEEQIRAMEPPAPTGPQTQEEWREFWRKRREGREGAPPAEPPAGAPVPERPAPPGAGPGAAERPPDHGSDPLGGGMHKMVPSGDIVNTAEKNRRLGDPKNAILEASRRREAAFRAKGDLTHAEQEVGFRATTEGTLRSPAGPPEVLRLEMTPEGPAENLPLQPTKPVGVPTPPTKSQILFEVEGPENTSAVIAKVDKGFSVTVRDNDSGNYLGTSHIYPTVEGALKKAEEIAPKGAPPAPGAPPKFERTAAGSQGLIEGTPDPTLRLESQESTIFEQQRKAPREAALERAQGTIPQGPAPAPPGAPPAAPPPPAPGPVPPPAPLVPPDVARLRQLVIDANRSGEQLRTRREFAIIRDEVKSLHRRLRAQGYTEDQINDVVNWDRQPPLPTKPAGPARGARPEGADVPRDPQREAVQAWLTDELGGSSALAFTRVQRADDIPRALVAKLAEIGVSPYDAWQVMRAETPSAGAMQRILAKAIPGESRAALPPARPGAPPAAPGAPEPPPAGGPGAPPARAPKKPSPFSFEELSKGVPAPGAPGEPPTPIISARPRKPDAGFPTGAPDLANPDHVVQVVRGYGGIKVTGDLRGELKDVPLFFKNRAGQTLDRMAEMLVDTYGPILGTREEVKERLLDTMRRYGQLKAAGPSKGEFLRPMPPKALAEELPQATWDAQPGETQAQLHERRKALLDFYRGKDPEGPRPISGASDWEQPSPPKDVQHVVSPEDWRAKPGESDVDLFQRRKGALDFFRSTFSDETGSMSLSGLGAAGEKLARIQDDMRAFLAPASRGIYAQQQAGIMREQFAILARKSSRAQKLLQKAELAMEGWSRDQQLRFIHAIEEGRPPRPGSTAAVIRELLDERRAQVQALGLGKLDHFIEDYFPHIWKNPTEAADAFAQAYGRRPLAGSGAFLKPRTIPTIKEGLAILDSAGKPRLELVSTNPVTNTLLKLREMDRYVMGQNILKEMKDAGLARLVGYEERAPAGWARINDKIARAGSAGQYWAPEQAAKLLNNHLTPGLVGNALFDLYRGLNNNLNQLQLGFSAFHLGFVSWDVMQSKLALSLQNLVAGRPLESLKQLVAAPAAFVTSPWKGHQMLKEFYAPGTQGAEMGALLDAFQKGGGRAHMERFYGGDAWRNFRMGLKRGEYAQSAWRIFPALLERVSMPIMELYVPRAKMGVFADLAKFELSRMPANAAKADQVRVLGRAWDSVENRLGQMTYDNLFWNRTFKDALMGSVRSVGWNLGTFRELGGGIGDWTTAPIKALRGEGFEMTPRMAYTATLPFTTMMAGAAYMYLATGKGPETLKDYYYPRTGRFREDGSPDRVSLPTYMKDVVSYGLHPYTTLKHKLSPMISLMSQMAENQTYYGGEIFNPDDPRVYQLMDMADHLMGSTEPFSIRGYQQQTKIGATPGEASQGFFGIVPAPASITRTAEEQAQVERRVSRLAASRRRRAQEREPGILRRNFGGYSP